MRLLERLLHPYRIEFLAILLPYVSEPATFYESILSMEFDASGIERGYAGQDIRNAFFSRAFFERTEQHLSQTFSSMVRKYEIRRFGSS